MLHMVYANLLIAAAAYLLGSIPTGYLLVRLFRHQDIRTVGSGNIGATNVLRAGGKQLGAATFLIDMLKGCSSVWLGALLGAASFPLFAYYLVKGDRPLFYIAVQAAVALIIILKHHPNIRRLLAGTESRIGAKKAA
jgi:glycerol-3-phosphate acyltransferase PlsY